MTNEEGEFKNRIIQEWRACDKLGKLECPPVIHLSVVLNLIEDAKKEILEAIEKHIEELVAFWRNNPDSQKQKVAKYYIDAYLCLKHNILEEDSFKVLKWFGSETPQDKEKGG